jgi:Na+-driven multidrug efflux pump
MWGVRMPMALIFALWFHLSVYYVWTAMIAERTVQMELL